MLNKAIVKGIVTQKEYKNTVHGKFICNITVETWRNFKDSMGNDRRITTWHNINSFDRLADKVNDRVNVGNLVLVKGEMLNKKRMENGVKKFIHSIVASSVEIIE